MKYSNDGVVSFDEKTHTYLKNGSRLTSVTSLLSKYKNLFDSDYHSNRIAIKRGISKEDILKEWKDKADLSTTMGTFIHKIFEDYTLGLNVFDTGTYQKEKTALKFIKDFFDTGRLKAISCETIVYNDFLAGQIDNVSEDKKGNRYILDWKTNSEISKNNYGKFMLNEFSSVPDCSYYHYCLQTNIYAKLLGGIDNCFIVHIKENDYEIIEAEDFLYKIDLSRFGL